MQHIDLNCDMGEGMPDDLLLFPLISSANIACGGHAGDEELMRRSVGSAITHGIAIGAHPSYPDRKDFGRVDLLGRTITLGELPEILLTQLTALEEICRVEGARLHHIKLHGALYNRAAKDQAVSECVCRTIAAFNSRLLVYGLSGSVMETVAKEQGLAFVSEVFADRTYQDDGSLTPRTADGALIEDDSAAVHQVLYMVRQGKVKALSGREVPLVTETLCLHGDSSHAVQFARLIRETFRQEGILVRAPSF